MRTRNAWTRRKLIKEIVSAAVREVQPIYKPQTPQERVNLFTAALNEMIERRDATNRAIAAIQQLIEQARKDIKPEDGDGAKP